MGWAGLAPVPLLIAAPCTQRLPRLLGHEASRTSPSDSDGKGSAAIFLGGFGSPPTQEQGAVTFPSEGESLSARMASSFPPTLLLFSRGKDAMNPLVSPKPTSFLQCFENFPT